MKQYLVLFSLAAKTAAVANKIVSGLEKIATEPLAKLWFDAAYAGIAITTEKTAAEIYKSATGTLGADLLRDILVIEIGRDWAARQDAKAAHWLATHIGHPPR